MGRGQAVRHRSLEPALEGSNPSAPAIIAAWLGPMLATGHFGGQHAPRAAWLGPMWATGHFGGTLCDSEDTKAHGSSAREGEELGFASPKFVGLTLFKRLNVR